MARPGRQARGPEARAARPVAGRRGERLRGVDRHERREAVGGSQRRGRQRREDQRRHHGDPGPARAVGAAALGVEGALGGGLQIVAEPRQVRRQMGHSRTLWVLRPLHVGGEFAWRLTRWEFGDHPPCISVRCAPNSRARRFACWRRLWTAAAGARDGDDGPGRERLLARPPAHLAVRVGAVREGHARAVGVADGAPDGGPALGDVGGDREAGVAAGRAVEPPRGVGAGRGSRERVAAHATDGVVDLPGAAAGAGVALDRARETGDQRAPGLERLAAGEAGRGGPVPGPGALLGGQAPLELRAAGGGLLGLLRRAGALARVDPRAAEDDAGHGGDQEEPSHRAGDALAAGRELAPQPAGDLPGRLGSGSYRSAPGVRPMSPPGSGMRAILPVKS